MLARSILISILFSITTTAMAQSLDQRLLDLSSRLDDAQRLAKDGDGLNMDELSTLALELEALMSEMRAAKRNLSGEQESIETEFYAESQDLMKVIGFLITFKSQPAPDYILHPDGEEAAVEANIIVQGVMDDMQAKLADVAQKLKTWRDIENKESTLDFNANSAFQEINRLRDNIVAYERKQTPELETDEPMVLDALYAVSTSLGDFVGGLDQITMSGKAAEPFSMDDHRGELSLPVYGEPIAYRQGVKIPTSDSFVTAPVNGTVRFVAEFLDYGQMMILEPEKDYLVILAGFDQPVVSEGDVVKANDIIGFFSKNEDEDANSDASPLRITDKSLYVEARYNTVPVNVMDYFHPKSE